MIKVLIIPDVHHRTGFVEHAIKTTEHDTIVFLGDYFDNFDDDSIDVKNTCEWLMDSVNKPNRIHLMGNHDIHYLYDDPGFRCSGYQQWKHFIIRDTIPHDLKNKIKPYHFLNDNTLLSHAGLHKCWIPENIKKLIYSNSPFREELSNYLDQEFIKGFRHQSWIFNAGKSRGGYQRVGGLIWCDFREFHPVLGLNQIFGHTADYMIRWAIQEKNKSVRYVMGNNLKNPILPVGNKHSLNLCLDVRSPYNWCVVDDKNITIHQIWNNEE